MRHEAILELKNLKQYFPIKGGIFKRVVGHVRAVDDISIAINEQETLALVGESGCGKSTTGKMILRLIQPTDGDILYNGQNIAALSNEQFRALRKDIQIIFQDPYSSLNPRMTVRQLLLEPILTYKLMPKQQAEHEIIEILKHVGLTEKSLSKYPHEFSGGQRQRISIARALVLKPKFLVLDEPVSALDVSIQAQILNLLKKLQQQYQLTYLFISHDLNVVRHVSDRIAVMYLGHIVEIAPAQELFENPKHPYSQALISAIPKKHPNDSVERIILKGEIPDPSNPPEGCPFHTRCLYVQEQCKSGTIPSFQISEQHDVKCVLYENA
ncbi:ABC transporter ATP-binding protein [Solibacillus daqui]|uniref:ABC transporter ATP-binding protein n=1 Tax=Solibacillus daqui TaxID=2912187 RepID=UPI0023653A81|nr:oligopeptide/dipeptide ABC transporter ATP-binding protein [Solibacillus daqui]